MLPDAFFQAGPNLELQRLAFLSPVAKIFSLLGNEEFFLLLLPLVYLCFSRSLGARLGALLLLSEALNVCLKVLFALPRPYWTDSSVRALAEDKSFGLPSSHAQNAAAVWPFLARGQKFGLRVGAAVLVAGVALSRVFLGVHFVGDVVAGVLIGVGVLWAFCRLSPPVALWLGAQDRARQVAFGVGVALAMLALFALAQALAPSRAGESWAARSDVAAGLRAIVARAGAMCGLILGATACARRGAFEAGGSAGERAMRLAVALVGVAIFWKGIEGLVPRDGGALELAWRFVRYGLMSWWITDATPRLFERHAAPVGD